MKTTSPMGRLAEARPPTADRTADLVGAAERDALLRSILATEEPTWGRAPSKPRWRIPLAAALAGPAVAGLAVIAVVWAGMPSTDTRTDTDVPTSVDAPGTAAAAPVVLDRVRLAVSAAEDLILHMKSDHGNGVLWEAWHDNAGRASRSRSLTLAGAPIYDHEMRRSGEGRTTVRVVSYNDRAWWTYETGRGPGESDVVHGLSVADIRSELANGTMEEIGTETLDGRAVRHLRWMPESKPGFVTVPGDMWVDATTYLPVRSVSRWGVKGEKSTRSDYEWLPRSAEALATLTAPIPAGFVQRAGAPEQPVGASGVG